MSICVCWGTDDRLLACAANRDVLFCDNGAQGSWCHNRNRGTADVDAELPV